ncbi:MAG: succinate dehydrogenase cytochrome b subunit [Candidatus Binatia bacterium]
MTTAPALLASTIGKKIVMAVTGVVLFGFVVLHMVGNLQLYLGPRVMNDYAVVLRESLHGGGLWIARAVLLAATLLHVWAAVSLTRADLAARPIGYREWRARESTYASRTMRWSGAFLAAFVVYHLLDLTIGTLNPGFEEGNVYHNVVASFRVVPVAAFYVGAMGVLGMHLKHGTLSLLRTLGLSHPRYELLAGRVLTVVAAVVVAANISFPIAVLCGVVR